MRIGFYGCGNMGEAILNGILSRKLFASSDIVVYEKSDARRILLTDAFHVKTVATADELAADAEIILLALKPNTTLGEIKNKHISDLLRNKAVISIAAGIKTNVYRDFLPYSRTLRVMPNTPAMVGMGANVFCMDNDLTEPEMDMAKQIFACCGTVTEAEEKYFDVITALSGSGPAYIMLIAEALCEAGVREGLPASMSQQLTIQTILGTSVLLKADDDPVSLQRARVTSPGGTTAEGVYELEAGAVRASIQNAVRAACRRSKQISEELK